MNDDDATQLTDEFLDNGRLPANDLTKAPLAEDNDSPAAPAQVPGSPSVPIDDPKTDTGIDPTESYQDGVANASGNLTANRDTHREGESYE